MKAANLYSSQAVGVQICSGKAGTHELKLWPLRLPNSAVRGVSSWPHLWLMHDIPMGLSM